MKYYCLESETVFIGNLKKIDECILYVYTESYSYLYKKADSNFKVNMNKYEHQPWKQGSHVQRGFCSQRDNKKKNLTLKYNSFSSMCFR